MGYQPLTFEEFLRRLGAGRYTKLKAARLAISATPWSSKVRAQAVQAAEGHFIGATSGPPRQRDVKGLVLALEGLVAWIAEDPVLVRRVRSLSPVLGKLLSAVPSGQPAPIRKRSLHPPPPSPPKPPTPKPLKPKATLPVEPGPLAKVDVAHLFDGPAVGEEDDEDDDDDDAPAPSRGNGGKGASDLLAAAGDSTRPDIEKGIEELDAKIEELDARPISDKEKETGRALGRFLFERRNQEAVKQKRG